MAVRRLLIGEATHRLDLGSFQTGLQRTSQQAVIVPVNDEPELFVETRTRLGPLTGAISWLHLPVDGLDAIEEVAQTLVDDLAPPAASTSDRAAGLVLRLLQMLVRVAFAGVLFGVPAVALGILPDAERSMPVIIGALLGAMALHWAVVLLIARVLDEPVAATIARIRCGRPSELRPMGTWQGPDAQRKNLGVVGKVWLAVMAAHGRRRWLVLTRTHRGALSAGVALYRVPAEQCPQILQAIEQVRLLRAAGCDTP